MKKALDKTPTAADEYQATLEAVGSPGTQPPFQGMIETARDPEQRVLLGGSVEKHHGPCC